MQVGRGLAGIGSYGTFLFAISYIPLADALAIEFSSPMIVVALSAPLLGERVGGKRWAVVLAGFAGTLLIVRPGMGVVHWAATLMLFAAFCVALMQLMSAVLAKSRPPHDFALLPVAYRTRSSTSLPVPFFWELLDPSAWALMVMVGAIAAFCHYLFVWAFQFAAASLLAPFIYAQIVGALVLGYRAIFGDVPDRWAVAGTDAGGGLRTLPRPHLSPGRPPLSEAGREQEGLLIPPQKASESRQRNRRWPGLRIAAASTGTRV